MNTLRVRPLLVLGVVGLLLTAVTSVGAWKLLARDLGSRSDVEDGPLTNALRSSARAEVERVSATFKLLQVDVDEALLSAARLVEPGAANDAAVSWVPGLCTHVAWPAPVERAGVLRAVDGRVLSVVELTGDRCVDRTGTLAIQSVTGPPFPTEKDVVKLALMAQLGSQRAVEDTTRVVAVHREGLAARVRLARRFNGVVVFADVDLRRLVPVVASPGVELHTLLVMGQEPAGYILGGPKESAIPGAIRKMQDGTGRALDLPDVANEGAARSVDVWLRPWRDKGDLALGGVRSPLEETLGLEVLSVACVPAPAQTVTAMTQLVLWILMTGCAWLILLTLSTRRLAHLLWQTAQQVREAWLGLRDDDVGGPEDTQRAKAFLATLTDRMQELLVAAFGRGEKFWAPAPIKRLLQVLRKKLDG